MIAPIPLALGELQNSFGIGADQVLRADLGKDGTIWLEALVAGEHQWFRKTTDLARAFAWDDESIPLCGQLDFQAKGTHILSWRPGRRIALRVCADTGFEVLKGLRPKKLAAAQAAYTLVEASLNSKDDFLVPRVHVVPEWTALRMNGLPQEPIATSAKSTQTYEQVGHALARFQQRVPAQGLALRGFKAELAVLGELAQRHISGLGGLPEGWDSVRNDLHEHPHFDSHSPVACHRDLHDGQLLAGSGRVVLLDFDLLAAASPLLDLGNLIAHLHLRALQGIASGPRAAELCEQALLKGYGQCFTARLQTELSAYKSSTFLRLALVYSMRPRWRSLTLPLIQAAKQCLDEPQTI